MAAPRNLCALVLGAGAALAVGCGGDRSTLLPPEAAGTVRSEAEAVVQAVEDGDCSASSAAVDRARAAVRASADLDPKLRSRLLDGLGKLSGRAQTECAQAEPEEPATTTETVPTTETTAPETTSTETEPPVTEEPAPEEPVDPVDPGPDPADPNGGGVGPEDPGTDPGTVTPDPGGVSPEDDGEGDGPGLRGGGRDRGAPEGYLP